MRRRNSSVPADFVPVSTGGGSDGSQAADREFQTIQRLIHGIRSARTPERKTNGPTNFLGATPHGLQDPRGKGCTDIASTARRHGHAGLIEISK